MYQKTFSVICLLLLSTSVSADADCEGRIKEVMAQFDAWSIELSTTQTLELEASLSQLCTPAESDRVYATRGLGSQWNNETANATSDGVWVTPRIEDVWCEPSVIGEKPGTQK